MNIGVGEVLLISLCGFVIVFLLLLFLILILTSVSRIVVTIEGRGKASAPAAEAAAPAPAPAAAPTAAPAKPWDGQLQLIDVDEKTAACIMAIVSHETNIPLEELQFRRIQAL